MALGLIYNLVASGVLELTPAAWQSISLDGLLVWNLSGGLVFSFF
jgi:hypothetical protein